MSQTAPKLQILPMQERRGRFCNDRDFFKKGTVSFGPPFKQARKYFALPLWIRRIACHQQRKLPCNDKALYDSDL